MADVMDAQADALDRPERQASPADGSPLPPPPPPPRRRERDSRERRDDYYDLRNRSPPPPIASRDRDYRRRSSLSPPPYRDRRHSPPRRSPQPGGFKRSRRDDGSYERRRGSPRYGYDYGGYDRGSRGGYDDRSYGRYMSRPSDWPDAGRVGFDVSQTQREGLMNYKQFIQELEDDILPAEAERRYEEYRTEYISTQKRAYFEAHKDEEWLKDKYHPTNLVAVIERRNEHARAAAKEILLDLQSGTLDLGPGLTSSMSNKSGNGSDPFSDDEADVNGKRRRHGRGPAKENDLSTAPKAHPVSGEPGRIQVDIIQAQALVRKVDNEKGIKDNILSSTNHDKLEGENSHGGSMGPIIIIRGLATVKGLEGAELLDTLLTYLWRVHGIDYYGMLETNEGKGPRHVRADGKGFDGSNVSVSGADWEKKLDLIWKGRLVSQDPLEIMTAKEKIDAAAVEALDPFVRKIRDEKYGWKYGCGAKGCTKLFHAAEFVHKHLRLKHPELVFELTLKVREDLYFQNYMNDPKAPGGTPIMQQPAPRTSMGRDPTAIELHTRTHQCRADQEWVDQLVRIEHADYVRLREVRDNEGYSSTASCPQSVDSQLWTEAAGGKKGRIHGLGSNGGTVETQSTSLVDQFASPVDQPGFGENFFTLLRQEIASCTKDLRARIQQLEDDLGRLRIRMAQLEEELVTTRMRAAPEGPRHW